MPKISIFGAGLSLVVLLAVGCDRVDAPVYNHLRTELLRETLVALEHGDSEEVLAGLERLAAMSDDHSANRSLTQQERNRLALDRVNVALAEGDLGLANRVLDEHDRTFGANDELERVKPAIVALSVLETYLQRRPYRTADNALTAFSSVTKQQAVLGGVPAFAAWAPMEAARLQEQKRIETERKIDTLIAECELAVARGETRAETILEDIVALQPQHVVSKAVRQFEDGKWEGQGPDWERFIEQKPGVYELLACLHWERLRPDDRRTVAERLAGKPCHGLTGWRLRFLIALDTGDKPQALHAARQFAASAQPPAAGMVARGLETLVLPQEQFRARPWRTPFPAVSDVLSRVTQLREQMHTGK